jgi:hypothetical protein
MCVCVQLWTTLLSTRGAERNVVESPTGSSLLLSVIACLISGEDTVGKTFSSTIMKEESIPAIYWLGREWEVTCNSQRGAAPYTNKTRSEANVTRTKHSAGSADTAKSWKSSHDNPKLLVLIMPSFAGSYRNEITELFPRWPKSWYYNLVL